MQWLKTQFKKTIKVTSSNLMAQLSYPPHQIITQDYLKVIEIHKHRNSFNKKDEGVRPKSACYFTIRSAFKRLSSIEDLVTFYQSERSRGPSPNCHWSPPQLKIEMQSPLTWMNSIRYRMRWTSMIILPLSNCLM